MSQARNVGIELSTGHLIAFFDDDVILDDDCLEQLCLAMKSHPDLTGVGAIERQLESMPLTHLIFYDAFFVGPFRDAKYGMYRNWRALAGMQSVTGLKTCGAVFRREYLDRYGFDERWRAALLEDLDLCWQGGEGARFGVWPGARLMHEYSQSRPASAFSYRNQAAAWVFFFKKNRQLRRGTSAAFAWLVSGLVLRATLACLQAKSFAPAMGLATGLLSARIPGVAMPSIDPLASVRPPSDRSAATVPPSCPTCAKAPAL